MSDCQDRSCTSCGPSTSERRYRLTDRMEQRGVEDTQRFIRSTMELIRDTVAEAHENIVAVSLVYAESQETVRAHIMVEETLNGYAHHLAEKLRAHGYSSAADLIDPEVTT